MLGKVKSQREENGRMDVAVEADPLRTQVICLAGDLRDTAAIQRLDSAAAKCVTPGRRRVVLDLEGVSDADTRLVAELITIVRRAARAGVAWQVRVSGKLRHWITLYKLDRVLLADRRAAARGPAVAEAGGALADR